MDPNPKNFPILSYVMARIPTFGRNPNQTEPDIEQPPHSDPSPADPIFDVRPRMMNPEVMAAMKIAVADVAQTRSVLRTIGERPDHEAVDRARAKLADLGSEGEREIYKAVVQLEEMHEAYDKLLREAEARLERIYESMGSAEEEKEEGEEEEEVNGEVVEILQSGGGGLERLDLSARKLRFLPEAFGKMKGLRVFDISGNQLVGLPDSISGLENLEELNVSSNALVSLPDSIGLLQKLKILNVSANKLNNLPDSISHCRALVELDASFNNLSYLPTNIGFELVNLEKLLIQLNKIRSLPTSVCEMKSLRYLDAHFNELHGLPIVIGKLSSLEVLNLGSNFSDLTELPDTIGDLTNLKELDLSNNQIHALPDTFGRLDSLVKLNLDQNPIAVPPQEVVSEGVEAVKVFMAKRWLEILEEEERRCNLEVQEQAEAGWLTRSTSWVKNYVSGYIAATSPKAQKDSYLDQQL